MSETGTVTWLGGLRSTYVEPWSLRPEAEEPAGIPSDEKWCNDTTIASRNVSSVSSLASTILPFFFFSQAVGFLGFIPVPVVKSFCAARTQMIPSGSHQRSRTSRGERHSIRHRDTPLLGIANVKITIREDGFRA